MISVKTQPVHGVNFSVDYDPVRHKLFLDGQEVISPPPTEGGLEPHLHIILGESCNFHCGYCRQDKAPVKCVPDVKPFLKNLERYLYDAPTPALIGFWGGETLLYFDQIKALHKELKVMFPNAVFKTVTNGTLFTRDKADYCIDNGFEVSLSHDGPGQNIRGVDPLDDLNIRANFQSYIDEMGILYLTPVVTAGNRSYTALIKFLREKLNFTDDQYFIFTMSSLIATVEEAVQHQIPESELEQFARDIYIECLENSKQLPRWGSMGQFADLFVRSLGNPFDRNWRCAENHVGKVVVDINGDVWSCLFHKNNRLCNLEGRHASQLPLSGRAAPEQCKECAVVQICQGGCRCGPQEFYKGNCKQLYYWCRTCLALAINKITGLTVDGLDFDIDEYQRRHWLD